MSSRNIENRYRRRRVRDSRCSRLHVARSECGSKRMRISIDRVCEPVGHARLRAGSIGWKIHSPAIRWRASGDNDPVKIRPLPAAKNWPAGTRGRCMGVAIADAAAAAWGQT